MKKNGFTLVELLATLIVLGIVGTIVFPIVGSIINTGKESLYQDQLDKIKSAAEEWAYLNLDLLPDENSEEKSVTVPIIELQKKGHLPINIRDPRNDELLTDKITAVIIYYDNGKYSYVIDEESENNIVNEYNENSPILVLNGNPLEYVEFDINNTGYVDKGAKAKDKYGSLIDEDEISVTYQYNGDEISSLSTNEFKTYTVVYSVTSVVDGKSYTSKIMRTIIVRDTTAPELSIPGKTEITLNEASSFNPLEGVSAPDNSGETIIVTYSGFDVSVGQKIVSYTACDSHNNCITKKRIINIVEN